MDIKLSDLVRSKLNVRKEYIPETVQDLASSIMVDGLISRIVLRAVEDGKYEVLAGGRRVEALRSINELNKDYVLPEDHYIIRDVTDFEGLCISVSENVQRLSFSTDELCDAAKIMRGLKPKITTKEIAERLWETEARIKRIVGVAKDYDDIPELVKEEFKKSGEDKPGFTDAHWDVIRKNGGAAGLGSDTVKDVCEYIIDNEIVPSKSQAVVDKMSAKAEVTRADDPESSGSSSSSSSEANPEDETFIDKFKGELKFIEDDGKKNLYVCSKREETPLDLEHYKNYLESGKFKVFLQGKITFKPIE